MPLLRKSKGELGRNEKNQEELRRLGKTGEEPGRTAKTRKNRRRIGEEPGRTTKTGKKKKYGEVWRNYRNFSMRRQRAFGFPLRKSLF